MFLFDTDHIVFLQRGSTPESGRIISRAARHVPANFYFPVISLHEEFLGWNSYINRGNTPTAIVHGYSMMEGIAKNFAKRQVASFELPAATEFESLRRQRVRIGTMDLRIAAIALVRGYTVLSRNLVDFQKVPGLVVEDWTKP